MNSIISIHHGGTRPRDGVILFNASNSIGEGGSSYAGDAAMDQPSISPNVFEETNEILKFNSKKEELLEESRRAHSQFGITITIKDIKDQFHNIDTANRTAEKWWQVEFFNNRRLFTIEKMAYDTYTFADSLKFTKFSCTPSNRAIA